MAFQVKIVGDINNPRIEFSGSEQRVVGGDPDYAVMGVNWEALKTRIEQGWGKGRPKAIYGRNAELPWGDQSYQQYGLTELTIRRRIRNAWIVSADTRPYVAVGLAARNMSRSKAEVGVDTNLSLTHSMSQGWNAEVRAGYSQTVSVEVGGDTYGGKVGASSTWSVEASYGQSGSQTREEQIGTGAHVNVELDPHMGAQAKLTATRGSIQARVEYETTWWGHLWIDYGKRVYVPGKASRKDGHFFYFEGIENHNWGSPRIEYQDISLDLYANANIDIEEAPVRGESGM
ncbi:MAG: hypothetical protein F4Y84_07620 [Caldilineaceae bacterium SB0665_bin_25]|nr:hypothetical protein [Caldilineaceae bacterium SB0665_bin_25]